MSSFALLLVFLAAITHAIWNLAAKKGGGATVLFAFLSAFASFLIWGPLTAGYIYAFPEVSPASWSLACWGIVALSGMIHAVYFSVLLHGYSVAPLSVVYPVARGTGPLISSFAAAALFGETLTSKSISGIGLIVCGVLLLASGMSPNQAVGEHGLRRGVLWGALTGLTISLYTVVDAYGVKTLGIDPVLYDYGTNFFRMLILLPIVASSLKKAREINRVQLRGILAVAILSPAAYIMVLFAIKIAPVSHVAPARELSLMFGAFFGGKFLAEGHLKRRMSAAGLIALGVVLLA
jgi:drug/metabolite transporter (DMT)-like permease